MRCPVVGVLPGTVLRMRSEASKAHLMSQAAMLGKIWLNSQDLMPALSSYRCDQNCRSWVKGRTWQVECWEEKMGLCGSDLWEEKIVAVGLRPDQLIQRLLDCEMSWSRSERVPKQQAIVAVSGVSC